MSGPGIDYREELARLGEGVGETVVRRVRVRDGVYHRLPDEVGQPFSGGKKRERERKEWRTTMTKAVIVNAGYD